MLTKFLNMHVRKHCFTCSFWGDYIWCLIPTYYHYLWIYHMESEFPDTFSRISIKNPRPFFDDIKMNLND